MNTPNEGEWIAVKDRRPTEADFPLWYYEANVGHLPFFVRIPTDLVPESHWQPARNYPLPPIEDADGKAFETHWVDALSRTVPALNAKEIARFTWKAALAYARKTHS